MEYLVAVIIAVALLVGGFLIFDKAGDDLNVRCMQTYGTEWRGKLQNNNANICYSIKTGEIKIAQ